jgi:hypothetical protein
MINGVPVIDADGHIMDWDDLVRPYMSERYRSRALFYPLEIGIVIWAGRWENTGCVTCPRDSPTWTKRALMSPCCTRLSG